MFYLSNCQRIILQQLSNKNEVFVLEDGTEWIGVDTGVAIKGLKKKELIIDNVLSFKGLWIIETMTYREDIIIKDDAKSGWIRPGAAGFVIISGCIFQGLTEIFPAGFKQL